MRGTNCHSVLTFYSPHKKVLEYSLSLSLEYASIHHVQRLYRIILQIVQGTITWVFYNSIYPIRIFTPEKVSSMSFYLHVIHQADLDFCINNL